MIYEVRVSPELIVQMATKGNEVSARCVEGLPEGATLVTCDPVYHGVDLVWVSLYFKVGEDDGKSEVVVFKAVYERMTDVSVVA